MTCTGCQKAVPARQRAHMGCGWLPPSDRVSSRARPRVPGVAPSEDADELCPYYATALPQVHEAAIAWLWRDKGQLQLRYRQPSPRLLDAIDVYHGAVMAAQDYLQRELQEKGRRNAT